VFDAWFKYIRQYASVREIGGSDGTRTRDRLRDRQRPDEQTNTC
jgi:hypothetical protein